MLPFVIKLAACIPMLLFSSPFAAAAEEMANSMAFQKETELKAQQHQVEKLTAMVEKLERKMEEMERKMEQKEDATLKFAGKVDAEMEALDRIVRVQLEAVNINGNKMKIVKAEGLHVRIRNEGMDIKHVGTWDEVITVRTNLPIQFKKDAPSAAFYYEVTRTSDAPSFPFDDYDGPSIGFVLDGSFPFTADEDRLGLMPDSIVLLGKRRVCFKFKYAQGCNELPFAPPFEKSNPGDVHGIGLIIHSTSTAAGGSITLFSTANGKYMGSVRLPSYWLDGDLFPAISMKRGRERLFTNFGKKIWSFNPMWILSNE